VKIVITGSSGLIGTALVTQLRADGHDVLRMVRRAPKAADEIQWNPGAADSERAIGPAALDALQDTDAAVNLAGAPIAPRRWTARVKREILASRVDGTTALATALAGLRRRPAVLVSGSAIHWYGTTGDRGVDESSPAGTGFLAEVTGKWEAATKPAEQAGMRVVRMRTGLVLSKQGGILGQLLLPFRLGLGARLGSGTQFMSWIMLTDVVRAITFLLDTPDLAGPVNFTSPNPETNAAFTAAIAAALRRPAFLWLPAPVLGLALGEAASELLSSTKVLPSRLLAAGYTFRHPDIDSAVADELRSP
jgi:uncharacterized protein